MKVHRWSHAAPRTLVIACGALAREFLHRSSAQRLGPSFDHLPAASLHNRPERIPEAVRAKIRQERGGYERILVPLRRLRHGRPARRGPRRGGASSASKARIATSSTSAARTSPPWRRPSPRTFFLTDYLVRHFDTSGDQGPRARPLSRAARDLLRQLPPAWSSWPRSRTTRSRRRPSGLRPRLGLPLIVRADRPRRPRTLPVRSAIH